MGVAKFAVLAIAASMLAAEGTAHEKQASPHQHQTSWDVSIAKTVAKVNGLYVETGPRTGTRSSVASCP